MKKIMILALLLVSLGSVFPAAAQGEITFEPFRDENYKLQGYIPTGWNSVGNGAYAREADEDDPVILALQAFAATPEQLWQGMLPQFGLTEIPEVTETYPTEAFTWSLYQFEITVPQGVLKFDVALAADGGTVYVAFLQAPEPEFDGLHQSVFIPVLDALAPISNEDLDADLPYVVEYVTFENEDVTLAGTLTLPEGQGPFPAVVLVSGSGAQDRDETLYPVAEIKPFRLIADTLTQHGIAVLRYDDQGVGGSTGSVETTIQQNTSNAAAAVAYLLTRPEVNPDAVGMIGHSEGGAIVTVLGVENADLDFIVILAGPAVNGVDLLLKQNERLILAEGMTQEDADARVAFVRELLAWFESGDQEAARALMETYVREEIATLSEEELASLGDIETVVAQTIEQYMAAYDNVWIRSFLAFDPTPYLSQMTIPVLAIFGKLDVQVDAEQNAGALEAILQASGHPDYTIVTLENANHLFQPAQTGGITEYATLPQEFVPEFLPLITDWILARTAE